MTNYTGDYNAVPKNLVQLSGIIKEITWINNLQQGRDNQTAACANDTPSVPTHDDDMEPQSTDTAPEGEEQESTKRAINKAHDDTEHLQFHTTQMDDLSAGSPTMHTTGHNSRMDSHATNQDLSDELEDSVANNEDSMQDLLGSPAPWNETISN